MASKRKPLTFAELDNLEPQPKGRGAILRSAEEVEAEQRQLAESEVEELSFDDPKDSAKVELQISTIPQTRNSANPPLSNAAKVEKQAAIRTTYAKASYRMHPDAFDAISDAKRLLRRQFNLPVSLEEIAEKAILVAYNDLLENGESSGLVQALRESNH
jgi:hypothetical protein